MAFTFVHETKIGQRRIIFFFLSEIIASFEVKLAQFLQKTHPIAKQNFTGWNKMVFIEGQSCKFLYAISLYH